MKIKCKCGRKITLQKVLGFKTHAHCKQCKLEWHHDGFSKIYSHPYTKFKKRVAWKRNIQGKIDPYAIIKTSPITNPTAGKEIKN